MTSPLGPVVLEPLPLGRELTTFQPSQIGGKRNKIMKKRENFSSPIGSIKLKDAMSAALLNNPQLAEFAYEIRASEARAIQASLWPNPEISLDIDNIGGSGEYQNIDSLETTFIFSQTFLTAGKLQKAVSYEKLGTKVVAWDYEIQRVALLTDIRQQFIDVIHAQRQLDLLNESKNLSQEIYDLVDLRARMGDIPPVEATRAKVPLALADVNLNRAKHQLEVQRIELASLWGDVTAEFDFAEGVLDELHPLPELGQLVAVINQNPSIAKQTVEIARQDAAIRLEKAKAISNITGSIGYRYFNDENDSALIIGLSLPLAIFDRNQGSITEARYNRAKAFEAQHAAEVMVSAELSKAFQRLVQSYNAALSLKVHVVPPAREAYQATQAGFEQGNLRYLDVLDARKTLVENQLDYLNALGVYHRTVAQIEGLIGQSINSIEIE
ncbi:TolC family protein [Planctomycetota bacterium]|nr:TolC family protein [Planctomycetota bacterium]